MRLLLVDDDPEIRVLARVALERDGRHKVDVAASADEALERARNGLPQAVVLDVLLPDVEGPQLLERIRALPGLEDVPAVWLTARDGGPGPVGLQGARGVIMKPFDPLTLSARVERLLSRGTSDGRALRDGR